MVAKKITQCMKPHGEEGFETIENMNVNHKEISEFAFSILDVGSDDNILDIGCGGGRNIERFAEQISKDGRVVGIDYSEVSVEKSIDLNKKFIDDGIVNVLQGSVSEMPFYDETFDIATAFETIYFWPDFINDLKEVNRVLKKGGFIFICNEAVYREGEMDKYDDLVELLDMKIYSEDVLEESLKTAGFDEFESYINDENDWICIIAKKN
jgi:SAM-dependent methyltransferase